MKESVQSIIQNIVSCGITAAFYFLERFVQGNCIHVDLEKRKTKDEKILFGSRCLREGRFYGKTRELSEQPKEESGLEIQVKIIYCILVMQVGLCYTNFIYRKRGKGYVQENIIAAVGWNCLPNQLWLRLY